VSESLDFERTLAALVALNGEPVEITAGPPPAISMHGTLAGGIEVSEPLAQARFRRRTLALTDGRCARCGRPADVAHHVLPVGIGGDPEGPGEPLCRACHRLAHR
jgi:hypothetical protein